MYRLSSQEPMARVAIITRTSVEDPQNDAWTSWVIYSLTLWRLNRSDIILPIKIFTGKNGLLKKNHIPGLIWSVIIVAMQ